MSGSKSDASVPQQSEQFWREEPRAMILESDCDQTVWPSGESQRQPMLGFSIYVRSIIRTWLLRVHKEAGKLQICRVEKASGSPSRANSVVLVRKPAGSRPRKSQHYS